MNTRKFRLPPLSAGPGKEMPNSFERGLNVIEACGRIWTSENVCLPGLRYKDVWF